MMTSDDAWFDDLLRHGTETAPADLRVAVRQLIAGDPQPTVTPDTTPTRRPWLLPVTVAAATIATIGGLVLVANRGDDTITPAETTNPAPTTINPTSTTTNPISSTSTPASTTPASTALVVGTGGAAALGVEPPAASPEDLLIDLGLDGAEQPRVVSGEDAADALARIDAYRNRVLRSASGFAATSTYWTERNPDSPFPLDDAVPTADDPRVADLTVLETFATWAEYMNGDWYEYDPMTGLSHSVSETASGGTVLAAQTMWPPWWPAYLDVLSHDPLAPLVQERPWAGVEIEVSVATFEGSPAIQLRPLQGSLNVLLGGSGDDGDGRYLVDLSSGLIVEAESATDRLHSILSNVTAATELPISELPALPEGVGWERRDGRYPTEGTAQLTSPEQAATAFGPGLVLPAEAIEGGNVLVDQVGYTSEFNEVAPDAPDAVIRSVTVSWASFEGLTRTSYLASVERPGASGPLPSGYTQVGDHLCYELCVDQSAPANRPALTPRTGALAGTPFDNLDPALKARRDGVFYFIEGSSLGQAIDAANTLVDVPD